jgi:hypothetical protein
MPKLELAKLSSVKLPKLTDVEVPRPLYAGAGVADLALGAVKAYVDTITAAAQARRADVEARVSELRTDARALPEKVTAFYKETASDAFETYAGLAKRGEVLVTKLRGEAAAPVVKAPAVKRAPAKKAAAKKTTPKKA